MPENNVDIELMIASVFDQFRFCLSQIAQNPLALCAAGCAICAAAVLLFGYLTTKRDVF